MPVLHSERLAAIGEMAPRVAHAVRHPRGVLTVPTDLARRELGPGGDLAQAEAHREVVTDAIGHGAGLVQSDLQFGRPPQLRATGIT